MAYYLLNCPLYNGVGVFHQISDFGLYSNNDAQFQNIWEGNFRITEYAKASYHTYYWTTKSIFVTILFNELAFVVVNCLLKIQA